MRAKGVLLASAAAALILAGSVVAQAADEPKAGAVKCTGLNACKGQGSCAGAGNDCMGKNSCKGKGVTVTTNADECTKKGGKVVGESK